MEKKEVKIIGLQINQQFGIIQSCNLKFDTKNNLIVVKGKVGSGKSTLQKSLMLGTLGSNTLKDSNLYGKIDQETQLLDGNTKVFVGCKSGKKGELVYVIYTKDPDGKVIKEPVIDGVKLTPATYLKSLQTELTWKMDELTSENPTVQRDILLKLYKSDLANLGVVFDKKESAYIDSILGKIDLAENARSEKEHNRKKIGGFANHLEPLGIHIDRPETIPVRVDVTELEKEKNKLVYSDSTAQEKKDQKLQELKMNAANMVVEMKSLNVELQKENDKIQSEFDDAFLLHQNNKDAFDDVLFKIWNMKNKSLLSGPCHDEMKRMFENGFHNPEPTMSGKHELIAFDSEGRCASKSMSWDPEQQGFDLLEKLEQIKLNYVTVNAEQVGEDTNKEGRIAAITASIDKAKEINIHCDMVDSYIEWHDANEAVLKLKKQYAEMLSSVDTGVEGLKIFVDREDEKLSVYLTYDGSYDSKYFNNEKGEARKLSSYSGTQKPMICLLLQNYLLSKKPKAMRYLWIDNVPIDNKTKTLLDKMGKELDMTIIVNITGDFDHAAVSDGEILLDGGEIFFK
jgi:regulator of replication initiation timing